MRERGHTQIDVFEATKVPQSQVSRVLAGKRKRLTPAIVRLCQYAGIDLEMALPASSESRELAKLVEQLAGTSPAMARAIRQVLSTLAPFLHDSQSR